MGSFSWLRAEKPMNGRRDNLTYGDWYKILIPKEFGGGYIIDCYFDYGYVFELNMEMMKHFGITESVDLYGVLAYWNHCAGMKYTCDHYPETMEEIIKYGMTHLQENRHKGIDIGCYDEEVDKLEFPLKLVALDCNDTYEECKYRSYSDPEQGFIPTYWDRR